MSGLCTSLLYLGNNNAVIQTLRSHLWYKFYDIFTSSNMPNCKQFHCCVPLTWLMNQCHQLIPLWLSTARHFLFHVGSLLTMWAVLWSDIHNCAFMSHFTFGTNRHAGIKRWRCGANEAPWASRSRSCRRQGWGYGKRYKYNPIRLLNVV